MTRFLKHFLLASALGLLGLPLLTWIADPLGGFHDLRIPGINANKPAAVSPKRETKALWIREARPDAILLGSSRVLLGLDPAHPDLNQYQAFNFAVTGAEMGEMEAQLRYAQKIRPLRLAIVGLDFYAFNGLDHGAEKDFPFLELPYWQQVAKILWSLESLEFTGKTIGRQNVKQSRWLENNGLMGANVAALKLSTGKEIFRSLVSQYSPKLCGFKLYDTVALKHFEQILNYAHENRIELIFFIPPVHAWLTEALYAQGMGNVYNQWKRELVRINGAVAARKNKTPFVVWDFSGYNKYTTEPLPDKSTVKMLYYYDGSHFTPSLGYKVLEKIMAKNPPLDFGFGHILSSKTIENALAGEEKERRLFLSSAHAAQEIEKFNEAINKIKADRSANCPQTNINP